jgi:hypothetical protein
MVVFVIAKAVLSVLRLFCRRICPYNPWLGLFRCERGDDLFETRIAAQGVPKRQQL